MSLKQPFSREDREMIDAWLVEADFPMAPVVRRMRDEVERLRIIAETALRVEVEMRRHRSDVWCGDYENALADLAATLSGFKP